MPLHPQARRVLAGLPSVWRDVAAIEALTAAKARALMNAGPPTLPAGVTFDEIEVDGAEGSLPGRLYRPSAGTPVGTLLWLQGGGFVLDSFTTTPVPATLAAATGCVVVSVRYRLAPEHRFPAAPEDCYAALRWAADRGPVAVGGESAGGNLAAVVALMARDRGGPEIPLQVLLCPMTARHFEGQSRSDPAVGALARTEAIEWFWHQYLGDRDGYDELSSPLHAQRLAGLPAAVVVTAEYDVLRDEGEAYAERLASEGVRVDLRRFEGMPHGFTDFPGVIDAADECLTYVGEAIRRSLVR